MRLGFRNLFLPLSSPWNNKDPVREELFSAERLEEHARSLAAAQPVNPRRGHSLSRRLADNGAVILGAYDNTVATIGEGHPVIAAAGRRHSARRRFQAWLDVSVARDTKLAPYRSGACRRRA